MSLPAPPDDPFELAEFPARIVPADYPYARIHHDRHEPEWFCDKGDCRFDPPPGAEFGTCYLAGHPLGAFVEKFGRLRVVPRSLVDQHAVAQLRLTSPIRVADVTDRTILGRWRLTAELWAGDDYPDRSAGPTACTKPALPVSGTRRLTTYEATSTASLSSASQATNPPRSCATGTTRSHSD